MHLRFSISLSIQSPIETDRLKIIILMGLFLAGCFSSNITDGKINVILWRTYRQVFG